ncbi:MAG: hypothetical protein KDM91_06615 [Verrucomicrobiae bacterium]|nr:hypothetical protein [Verrucomicrobiae bacterium]MCP5551417.1 hypothetical protein [Akkermansiaceae bacterium]
MKKHSLTLFVILAAIAAGFLGSCATTDPDEPRGGIQSLSEEPGVPLQQMHRDLMR